MAGRLLLIAAGGTGGHMFPAQALAETMLERGWRVKLSTDERGARYAGGFPAAVTVERVAAASFARAAGPARLAVPLRLLAGVSAALMRMLADRPAVVVGFGGYPSIPALSAAWLLRRPRMIHEQNAIPGRVNRGFARRVDIFACGIALADPLPGVRVEHVGNPVRQAVRERAGAPYIPPGDYPMSLVVIGGSQGARVFSDMVPAAVALLPEALRARLRVAHQARAEDGERAVAAYEGAGIRAEIAPFFDDIPRRLSEAQLVISRAGASSVADIAAIGRPSILIPYPHAAADHQSANARGMAAAGAAVVLPEAGLDAAALAGQIAAILGDPAAALRMAAAAQAQGRPDAVAHLAALAEELAGEGR